LKLSIFNNCDACGIVPAIFERPKAAHDDGYWILRTNVSEYAAHAVTGYQRDEPSITLAFRDRLSNTSFRFPEDIPARQDERALGHTTRFLQPSGEWIALMQSRLSTETDSRAVYALRMKAGRSSVYSCVGDTACTDHEIAKRVRDALHLNPPGGATAEYIVYSPPDGPSVFAHPVCLNTWRNGQYWERSASHVPVRPPFSHAVGVLVRV